MRFPRFPLFAALMLCLPLAACLSTTKSELVPAAVSPRDYIEQEAPSRVVVLLTNGEEWELRDPRIRNDSIVGVTNLPGRRANWHRAFALHDVRQLANRSTDAGAVVANAGLAVVYYWAALLGAAWLFVTCCWG